MSARRAIAALAFWALVSGGPDSALAQERSGIGVVSTLIGEATVGRAAMARPVSLKMRDDVFLQDRITTKERSLVHVLMGGKALLTVRELSVLTVTDDGGRATVDLQSGKVGLAVLRQRMKPGEVIEIRTPHAVAAVRGTVLVVEIVPGIGGPGGRSGTTNVHLLHGKLDVSLASNPAAPPVQLESLQSVSASSNALDTVRPLTREAAADTTAGLKTDQLSLPGPSGTLLTALSERHRGFAVATASALVRGGPAGLGALSRAAQKDGPNDAAADRDAIGLVADTVDGRDLTQNGSGFGGGGGNSFGGGNGIGGGRGIGGGNGIGGGKPLVIPKLIPKKSK